MAARVCDKTDVLLRTGIYRHKKFDSDITILLQNENVVFSDSDFEKESIIMTSHMLVEIAFGVSAIALDAIYDAAGVKKNDKSRESKDDLCTLVYMVRCAFAHNIAAPRWEAREQISQESLTFHCFQRGSLFLGKSMEHRSIMNTLVDSHSGMKSRIPLSMRYAACNIQH